MHAMGDDPPFKKRTFKKQKDPDLIDPDLIDPASVVIDNAWLSPHGSEARQFNRNDQARQARQANALKTAEEHVLFDAAVAAEATRLHRKVSISEIRGRRQTRPQGPRLCRGTI